MKLLNYTRLNQATTTPVNPALTGTNTVVTGTSLIKIRSLPFSTSDFMLKFNVSRMLLLPSPNKAR